MQITTNILSAIAGRAPDVNMVATIAGLRRAGVGSGLSRPHRLAQFLAQIAHESGGWKWDQEIWGPTAAQKRYDTRTDLGNTAAKDGDGYLYRGRGPIQITGRYNYQRFTQWARAMDPKAPDFVADPDAVLTDPWEGLVAIWYWDWKGLNALADAGNLTGITKKINGGTNGLPDRRRYYARAALVLLGYGPGEVKRFQTNAGLEPDGIAGPNTLAKMHEALAAAKPVSFEAAPPVQTTVSPGVVPWVIIGIGATIAALFAFGG